MERLSDELIKELETPCLVIDVAQAKRNIRAMQDAVDKTGCALRPHVKTSKMVDFSKMQVEAGCAGVCVAKITEAEVMAEGGIDDIFIAYPAIGEKRISRCVALSKRVNRLILAVDSLEGAKMLQEVAQKENARIEVRLEIDTGAGRTGIQIDRAVELAKEIDAMPNLDLSGIFTFKSLVYEGKPTTDNALAAKEEGELMASVAKTLRDNGIDIRDVSAGSTPTGLEVAKTGLVTEVRPGTYIFKDFMLTKENAGTMDEIAIRFYATVVSANHPEYAVIDGGTKTFPTDVVPFAPPFYYPGYALIEGDSNLHLSRMNEEHGIVTADNGVTGLKVGDVITLIPNHVCTAINMHNNVYLYENGKLTKHKVDARGLVF